MDHFLFEWLTQYPALAFLISIAANVFISLFAVIPSFFITTANIAFFGFQNGLLISFIGEVLGAIISFYLYKKGFLLLKDRGQPKYVKWFIRFENLKGVKAFTWVIVLRLLPFMPSGLVTLLAATSSMGTVSFMVASTLGKIPAIILEAYGANQLLNLNEKILPVMGLLMIVLVGVAIFKRSRNRTELPKNR